MAQSGQSLRRNSLSAFLNGRSGSSTFGLSGAIDGSASTANGHNLGEVFTSKGMTYAGGPAFQWNILNYGRISNNVRLQDARLQQLLVDYQSTVLSAKQQVDTGRIVRSNVPSR